MNIILEIWVKISGSKSINWTNDDKRDSNNSESTIQIHIHILYIQIYIMFSGKICEDIAVIKQE